MPTGELSTPKDQVVNKVLQQDLNDQSKAGSEEECSSGDSSPVNKTYGLTMFQDAMYKKLVMEEED